MVDASQALGLALRAELVFPRSVKIQNSVTADKHGAECQNVQLSQRSASNTPKPKPKPDTDTAWGHDLHRANDARVTRITRLPRDNPMAQLKKDLVYETAVNQLGRDESSKALVSRDLGVEISIRGTASPYVVVGSNFAPGTTAADIESAMIPTGGEMLSCRIMSASPTVIAEMVFSEKHNAESVISTFNNKKVSADNWSQVVLN